MTATTTAAATGWKAAMQQLRDAPRPEVIESIVTDDQAGRDHAHAQGRLMAARQRAYSRLAKDFPDSSDLAKAVDADPQVQAAEANAASAKERMEASRVHFLFRGLDPDVYDALVAKHPADDTAASQGAAVDIKTFGPALLSACHRHVTPDGDGGWNEFDGMGLEDATSLLGHDPDNPSPLNAGTRDRLLAAALAVNTTSRAETVDLGKGFGRTPH